MLVAGISATNVASGLASTNASVQVASNVSSSIAGTAAKDVLALAPIVVTGTPITISQIMAEAIFYQSLTQITRDMIEASFEGYATDTNMATVNAFRLSSNALQEAYAIVYKEISLRQFQTANTINVVSLASGAGLGVNVARGVAGRLLFGAGGRAKVFWTGGAQNFTQTMVKQKATEFAISRGAVTIEMTIGGKILNRYSVAIGEKYFANSTSQLWRLASASFAKNTTGIANVFQLTRGVGINSIWATIESRILLQNNIQIMYRLIGF